MFHVLKREGPQGEPCRSHLSSSHARRFRTHAPAGPSQPNLELQSFGMAELNLCELRGRKMRQPAVSPLLVSRDAKRGPPDETVLLLLEDFLK
jgi:hypothetical protein